MYRPLSHRMGEQHPGSNAEIRGPEPAHANPRRDRASRCGGNELWARTACELPGATSPRRRVGQIVVVPPRDGFALSGQVARASRMTTGMSRGVFFWYAA